MTSPLRPPGSGHVDVRVLADLDEDLLDPVQTVAVQAHLSGCESCRADQAAVHAVRAALAADDPGPMPAAVISRLDAALRAEAGPVSAAAGATAAVPSLAAARERRVRTRRAFPSRWLVGAAAAVVLVLGGGAIAVQGLGLGGGSSGGAASSGSAVTSGGQEDSAGQNGAAAGRSQSGTSGGTSGAKATRPVLTPPRRVLHTGDNYSPITLAPLVRSLLGPTAPGTPEPEVSPPSTPSPSPAESEAPGPPTTLQTAVPNTSVPPVPAGLPDCLGRQEVAPDTRPLAVDTGTWQQAPAIVVVLPAAQPADVRVLVLSKGCSATRGELLYETTLTR